MRIAIIGGGIAGLAAAFELEKAAAAADIDYCLFESSGRLGGAIHSIPANGCFVEAGPDSFLTEKPAAIELCNELGLADDLIGSNDLSRRTYIFIRNRLVPLPDGLMFLVPTKLWPTLTTPLFSLSSKLRMAMEFLFPPPPHHGDESVADMVKRHYGQSVVDRLADPLLSAIYGGDASQLSAQSVLPSLVQMEQKYGSLGRGIFAMRKKTRGTPKRPAKPLFTTLRGGLQQMTNAIVSRLPQHRIGLHTTVTSLARDNYGWHVTTKHGGRTCTDSFDAVILAVPAWAAAELLADINHTLSAELSSIPYSSAATVNFVYQKDELSYLPEGFGFLVPAAEQRSIMACTFVHRKFPERVARDKAVLRCFLGEHRNPDLYESPDEVIAERVAEDLYKILGITSQPEQVFVHRSHRAMAQYAVGHRQRWEKINQIIETYPGLLLAGNAYDGIGISDCIRTGQRAAQSALKTCIAGPRMAATSR